VVERVGLGIDPLDLALPEGVLRSSTVAIIGSAGTGKSVIVANIAYNFLRRGEEVVYVTLDDSPEALIEMLKSFNWEVDEFLSKGLLTIIDGFSFRLGGLRRRVEGVVKEVDLSDLSRVLYVMNEVLEERGVSGRGLVVVDSINELMFRFELTQILEFVRSVRAVISKGRKVLTLVTLHTTTDSLRELAAHLEYLIDGVVDTRIEPSLQEIGIPLKQLMVRKMRGVPTNPLWIPYVITPEGIRAVDQSKLAALIKSRLKEAITIKGARGSG